MYGEFGIKATAKDYQDIGNAFMELSQQAAARQDEIESKAVGLKDLLLGTTKFMSSPPNMETPEGLEYQKALNDGRILETSTGIYMIPDPEQLAQDKNIPEAIDVDTTLRQQSQDREATGIKGVRERDRARGNETRSKKK